MAYNNAQKFDVERERQLYYAALNDPSVQDEYKKVLGDIDLGRFLMAARDAVEANIELLDPRMRTSLLFAVKKAAQMQLSPDGKQGAIIPRWNSDARAKLASWQPMIQGYLKLGRRAGVIKNITAADMILVGEPFKHLRGDEPKIVHEWIPEIRERAYSFLRRPHKSTNQDGPPDDNADAGGPDYESFWDMVVGAYAIIEAPDGSKTRRVMTRSRLLLLRDFSKAKSGPWWSVWVDEMIIKSALHHTCKHIDTTPTNDAGHIFRAALDEDMDAHLGTDDDSDDVIDARPSSIIPALAAPNPMDKLNTLDARLGKRKETVDRQPDKAGPDRQEKTQEPPAAPLQQPIKEGQEEPIKKPPTQVSDADKARAFAGDISTKLADVIANAPATSAGEFATHIIVDRIVQSKFLRLKKDAALRPLYDQIIKECANPRISHDLLNELQGTPYEVFYFDLVQTIENKEAA